MTQADTKAVYAQSSDIKSRTYLEYRKDMKRKAIAELEVKDWLQEKLRKVWKIDDLVVQKSGGDSHLWFLRKGGMVTGAPDYLAISGDDEWKMEFQYADRDDLSHYDFKLSKVGRKTKNKRVPHTGVKFVYIIKPTAEFAFFNPEWIMENGEIGAVPAWGSRPAFRVRADVFKSNFTHDPGLALVIELIDKKNRLLEMQSFFVERERERLASELRAIVDKNNVFRIVPKNLEGFYKACFVLDSIGRQPEELSLPLWLVYGVSLHSVNMSTYDFARLIYSLDYLYGKAGTLAKNEIDALAGAIEKFALYIDDVQRRNFQTSPDLSPKDEIANFLFAVSLYEDLVQELIHVEGIKTFKPIKKIFQSVKDIDPLLAVLDG